MREATLPTGILNSPFRRALIQPPTDKEKQEDALAILLTIGNPSQCVKDCVDMLRADLSRQ